jgi:hypothetical protein
MMAHRAAEIDAKRKLVERILGLRITSDTLVKDFVAESDQIQAVTNGTLIGATIVRTYYLVDSPTPSRSGPLATLTPVSGTSQTLGALLGLANMAWDKSKATLRTSTSNAATTSISLGVNPAKVG